MPPRTNRIYHYPPDFVRLNTLSYRLDLAESTVKNYISKGILPEPIQFGNYELWRWADIETHINNLTTKQPLNRPLIQPFSPYSHNISINSKAYHENSQNCEQSHIEGIQNKIELLQKNRGPNYTENNQTCSTSFTSLISAYKKGPEYSLLKHRTRVEYDRHLATIENTWGRLFVRDIKARNILDLRDLYSDTPTKANHVLEVLSTIIAWGIPRDYTDNNPCRDVPKFKRNPGYPPWPRKAISHFLMHASSSMSQAAALALYTGQRCGDVLKMKWQDIDMQEIKVTQSKTGKKVWIPIHCNLDNHLENIERQSEFILTNSRGCPWSGGFQSSWNKQMKKPEMEALKSQHLVFHGLRKSAVVFLLEAGCTDAQVSAITGQTRQMVEHYSLSVNQRFLAKEAIQKWEESG